jgi:hypothetical protein
MNDILSELIFAAGLCQLGILIASSLVPFQLDWKQKLAGLPLLHRQMYFIYGGYVVLGIVTLGLTSLICSAELASGSPLARAFCIYATLFWGIRLSLQAVLDAKPFLTRWWLKLGYHLLTVLFAGITAVFGYATVQGFWLE